eukprot:366113-Chlamydomonas_euryale.AAC.10
MHRRASQPPREAVAAGGRFRPDAATWVSRSRAPARKSAGLPRQRQITPVASRHGSGTDGGCCSGGSGGRSDSAGNRPCSPAACVLSLAPHTHPVATSGAAESEGSDEQRPPITCSSARLRLNRAPRASTLPPCSVERHVAEHKADAVRAATRERGRAKEAQRLASGSTAFASARWASAVGRRDLGHRAPPPAQCRPRMPSRRICPAAPPTRAGRRPRRHAACRRAAPGQRPRGAECCQQSPHRHKAVSWYTRGASRRESAHRRTRATLSPVCKLGGGGRGRPCRAVTGPAYTDVCA